VRVLELLNTVQLESVPEDGGPRFVSLVLGSARTAPGGGVRVELAGGGHLPPLVVRRHGVEVVDIGGGVVGAQLPPRFHNRTVELAPGEACVLYTDGVTDVRNGGDGAPDPDGAGAPGEQRLAELLRDCHALPAPGIVDRILEDATRRSGGRAHDDMAVLVVQAPGTESARRHLRLVRPDGPGAPPGGGRHRRP
jgi:serine phosphatase RsbU (regulator of sigma subunit)